MKHAAVQMRTVSGTLRTYGTLCGLSGGHGTDAVTTDPVMVTCKSCRRSQAWQGFVTRYLEKDDD